MHDARWFEAAGIPACAVVSNGFVKQARYQAEILEASIVPQVFVPHPISDQTSQQMHAKADLSFDEVFNAITKVWVPPVCDSIENVDNGDESECET